MVILSKCTECKHYREDKIVFLEEFRCLEYCDAYPDGDGIPKHICFENVDTPCSESYHFEVKIIKQNNVSD